ncbi:MAG TPA: methionyl-tRNA formyltransferase [Planctomycetota bacterium]|nr:methionyl-tRNA formyltransferase [Planctomycetota bacterium]
MDTVFMGTPEIAVPALRALAAATTVRQVVTQPDRPAGRGNKLHPPAMKLAAQELGIPVWQPESLKGAEDDKRLRADIIVVMAYGALLRQPLLDRPRLGCVNLHASLLPRWRGASPLQAAIRAGDPVTGVSVMRMVRGLDAGPVFLRRELPLHPRVTLPELHDAMAICAAEALTEFLRDPSRPAVPQDEGAVTICRKLVDNDGQLDFTRDALELDRWVRAYVPAPGCWAMAHYATGEPLRLRVLAGEARDVDAGTAGSAHVLADALLVGCGRGAFAITRLQLPGGKPLSAADFLRGHRAPVRLG